MKASIVVLAIAAFFVCVVILIDLSSRMRKVRAQLSLLKQYISGSRVFGLWPSCSIDGTISNIPFVLTITSGGNRSRPKVIISCRQTTPFNIIILHSESQADLFERLKHMPVLSSLVKTNDPHFDGRLSIYSYNTADVTGYFYNTSRKDAVCKIFELGYNMLEFKGAEVTAQKYEYNIESDLQPDTLKLALEKVINLSKGFQAQGDR